MAGGHQVGLVHVLLFHEVILGQGVPAEGDGATEEEGLTLCADQPRHVPVPGGHQRPHVVE